ncbi:hypothetical protein HanOQP8_Chr08g0270551 [Helianthus annuus]|nr:hypothetical protein HanOQP8_Chr08g0270551 [Helianthus annuus]
MGDYGRIFVHEALGGGIVKKVYGDEDCSISGGTRKPDSTLSFSLDLNMEVEVHETRLLKVQCYRGRKR